MQFNTYNVYSYMADNLNNACDDKVLVDLQRLKSMKEYDEVKEYINKVFCNFEGEQKVLDYSNGIKVILLQGEHYIGVAGIQNDKQIFGLRWRLNV